MKKKQTYIDYNTIFSLYKIKKSTEEVKKHKIRQNIRRHFYTFLKERNYSENLTWKDLTQYDKDCFICIEIKEMMLKEHSDSKTLNSIQKNIDQYIKTNLYNLENQLKFRNDAIKKIHYKYKFTVGDENSQQLAYKNFSNEWKKLNNSQPPSYENFISHAEWSIYDYMMSEKTNHQENFNYFEFEKGMTQSTINSIVLKVLKELIGLEINYGEIKKCIENLYELGTTDYELDDFATFPNTVEEYIKEVTWKPIKVCKKNGVIIKIIEQAGNDPEDPLSFMKVKNTERILTDKETEELKEPLHTISESIHTDENGDEIEYVTIFVKDDSYTKSDIEEIKANYKNMMAFAEKYLDCSDKMERLTDFYKVDEEKLKRLKYLVK